MTPRLPSSKREQVAQLRRMAGAAPVSLTIKIEAHHTKTRQKHRRYFESDEAFAQHEREMAMYRSAERTFTWEYPTMPSLWSAADVDTVIAYVGGAMAHLPLVTEHEEMWYGWQERNVVATVVFDFRIRGRKHQRETITMTVVSGVGPYAAAVTLPERPPVSAIVRLIEIHGSADVEIGMRCWGMKGYEPTLAGGA